jgi:C-terminal processing protease CtpA/Prc/Flp pilus assembly protein TadD
MDLFDEKPFVTSVKPSSDAAETGVKAGAEVLEVDGLTIAERMERLRPYLNGRSSEWAYRRSACPFLLAGDKNTTVSIKVRSAGGGTESFTLKRDSTATAQPPKLESPVGLTINSQRFVHFGRHPSGIGYIRIASFNGREEIADEFDRALEALKDTPALILDIRNNQGGFGTAQPRIVGRFMTERRLAAISYVKNGPAHNNLGRHEAYFVPAGSWQYGRPVALLVNDVTGSAADLFACYIRSAAKVTTIGSTTHGNLSGVAEYVVLPSGLVVRISNGYVANSKDVPIEGNGNKPDIAVSPTISDFLNGRDPVLEKAVAHLPGQSGFAGAHASVDMTSLLQAEISKNPTRADLQWSLGQEYRTAKNFKAALECFRKVRELAPNNANAHLSFALMLEATGQGAQARPVYEQILKLQPDNAVALNNLAFRMAQNGNDLDQALTLVQRAKQMLPNNANVADTMGLIYIKKGRNDDAIRLFRELVERNPADVSAHLHLALALLQKGDKLQARKELEICVQNRPNPTQEAEIKDLMAKLDVD